MKRIFGLGKGKNKAEAEPQTQPKEKHRSGFGRLGMSRGKSKAAESSSTRFQNLSVDPCSDVNPPPYLPRSASYAGDRTRSRDSDHHASYAGERHRSSHSLNRNYSSRRRDSDHATSHRHRHRHQDTRSDCRDHERSQGSRKRPADWNCYSDMSKLPKTWKVTSAPLHRPAPVDDTSFENSWRALTNEGYDGIIDFRDLPACFICLQRNHPVESCPYHDSVPLDAILAPLFKIVCKTCRSTRHPLEHVQRGAVMKVCLRCNSAGKLPHVPRDCPLLDKEENFCLAFQQAQLQLQQLM